MFSNLINFIINCSELVDMTNTCNTAIKWAVCKIPFSRSLRCHIKGNSGTSKQQVTNTASHWEWLMLPLQEDGHHRVAVKSPVPKKGFSSHASALFQCSLSRTHCFGKLLGQIEGGSEGLSCREPTLDGPSLLTHYTASRDTRGIGRTIAMCTSRNVSFSSLSDNQMSTDAS